MIDDIAHLVEAARGGDRSAFGELYTRFARTVHGILLARGARWDVDDLVQDVFMIAMQRIATLRDSGAFGGLAGRHREEPRHRLFSPHTADH